MDKFYTSDFHWSFNEDKVQPSFKNLQEVVDCLNTLTDLQREAVRIYGKSCNDDGYDTGYLENCD